MFKSKSPKDLMRAIAEVKLRVKAPASLPLLDYGRAAFDFAKRLRLKRPRREQAAAGMSLDEIAAINLYTQDNQFHRALNLSLRTGQRRSACPFHPYLQILDSALSKLPPQKLVV